jgi:diguanylate cyclase (GGDEF)-like protein/PAS domain S-box-containing protein
MNSLSLQRLIAVAALLAFSILLAIGYGFYRQTQFRQEELALVSNTHQVESLLNALFSDLQDAETGQRGYLLTVEPAYLAPYTKAAREIPQLFSQLQGNTGLDDRRVQHGLILLHSLSTAKLAELKQSIDLVQAGNLGQAQSMVQTNHGKAIMDAIRQKMAALNACVKADHERRVRHLSDLDHDIALTVGYGGLLSLWLLATSFFLLNWEIRKRQASGQALIKAEERARRAQHRLELALEAADFAVWELNLKTGEAWGWNETAPMQAHDRKPPRSFQELAARVVPEDRDRLAEDQQRVLQSQDMVRGEYRLSGDSGEPYWLAIRMRAFKGPYATSILLAGITTDITEQKKAEETLHQTQQMLQLVLDHIPQRIFWKDQDSVYRGGNRIWRQDTGMDDPLGKSDDAMPWRELADRYRATDQETMRAGHARVNFEEPFVQSDGSRRWLRTSKIPLRGPDGQITGVLGTYEDITEPKRLEEALRDSEQRFRVATQNAPIGLGLLDFNGHWLQVNPALCQMLGYSEEEMLALNFRDVTFAEDLDIGVSAVQSLARGEADTFRVEKRHVHRSGRLLHVQIHAALVRDRAGKPQYYLGQVVDLTERKEMEARLHEMAHYDTLTGLPNRRLFRDRLQQAVSRCRRNEKLSALMYLDIDHFKQINDRLGHATGDAVLVAFAGRLKAAVRETDTVGRLGGDEFTVIAEGLPDAQAAFGIADKILTRLQDEVSLGQRRFHIATSIGICFFDGRESNIDVLLRQADSALYAAKRAGRNQYKAADPQQA